MVRCDQRVITQRRPWDDWVDQPAVHPLKLHESLALARERMPVAVLPLYVGWEASVSAANAPDVPSITRLSTQCRRYPNIFSTPQRLAQAGNVPELYA